MKQQAQFRYDGIDPSQAIAIVGPGNVADMIEFTAKNRDLGIFSIFDPGQSLPVWEPGALAKCVEQSSMLICNEYELGMIGNATGLSNDDLAGMVEQMVVTLGGEGADVYSEGSKKDRPCGSNGCCCRPNRCWRCVPRRIDQGAGPRDRNLERRSRWARCADTTPCR